MRRNHFGQKIPLIINDKPLIVARVISAFLNQGCNFWILQKKFVEPGNLRKYLQVGEVLRLKIFVGLIGIIAALAQALPKFTITGVAANHVNRVGLEKILQGEATLFGSKIFRWLGCDL